MSSTTAADTQTTAPGFTQPVTASTGMLIRRPVAEVYGAFVDPDLTSRFWFTRGSAPLEAGSSVTWHWDMYGAEAAVDVVALVPNERIHVRWGDDNSRTDVEWLFRSHEGGNATFVSITNSGFSGDADALCSQACDSTEGFALVLAGAKAWLEHGVQLNLTGDRFPAEEQATEE